MVGGRTGAPETVLWSRHTEVYWQLPTTELDSGSGSVTGTRSPGVGVRGRQAVRYTWVVTSQTWANMWVLGGCVTQVTCADTFWGDWLFSKKKKAQSQFHVFFVNPLKLCILLLLHFKNFWCPTQVQCLMSHVMCNQWQLQISFQNYKKLV